MLRLIVMIMALFAFSAHAEDRWKTIPDAPDMPQSMDAGMASVNGIMMYYATYGEQRGIPVLLIHGGLAHGDIWASQVKDLMTTHRVIIADTRGHGRSTNDGSAYTYELLAEDYLALLDHLGVDRVHLVGWSDGANIGYVLSQTAPERLASHTAHAGNVRLDGIDPTVETNAVFGQYVGKMAGDYAAMSSTPDGFNDFLGAVATMWGLDKPGGLEGLRSVTVPTLVLHSQYDEAILKKHSLDIAKSIPGASFIELRNVSHFSMFQAPDEYTKAIRGMVN